ncbi:unnamed protein product [Moneuplotes crassus]|uniref:t-SNARE coiled-coil homology domain-containing protein n=1 Tax=Euplotes crassus TaxID=5936 RepID=A0AAD1XVI4_EUPCR|nr:unnamed protein product [Moneuplotes crassus]
MSKFDSFNKDLNKLKKLESDIKSLLSTKKKNQKEGKSLSKIDYMLNGKVETFKYEVSRMREAVFNMNNNPFKFGISEREADKRRDKVDAYDTKLQQIESEIILSSNVGNIGSLNQQNSYGLLVENDIEENLLGEDGEYSNTRGKNNAEIITVEKQMLNNQDHHFDKLSAIAHELKYEAQEGGKEIDGQVDMLDTLNRDMDKTNIKMMRVDGRLKKLVAESNHCCLWCIIVLQLVGLVLLIVLL